MDDEDQNDDGVSYHKVEIDVIMRLADIRSPLSTFLTHSTQQVSTARISCHQGTSATPTQPSIILPDYQHAAIMLLVRFLDFLCMTT